MQTLLTYVDNFRMSTEHIFIFIAANITIDSEGLMTGLGRGWEAGKGEAPGTVHSDGGAGASHGGHGGSGGGGSYASLAYGNVRMPTAYGSGGPESLSDEGEGGGIIYLKALQNMEIDGDINVDGNSSRAGGGSGGSIVLEAAHFTGILLYGDKKKILENLSILFLT